jgi:hypothetical protein
MVLLALLVMLVLQELRDQLDLLDLQGLQDLALLAPQDHLEMMARQGLLVRVLQGLQVFRELLALQVFKGPRELLVKVILVRQGFRVLLDPQDFKEPQDLLAFRDPQELLAQVVLKVSQVLLGRQVMTDQLELLVSRVILELQVRLETTVPQALLVQVESKALQEPQVQGVHKV